MLRIKQNVLTLKGITLRGSIQLLNPNQNLAVIFEIQSPPGFEICIQPKRGIVMQQQIKTIKVWVKDEDRQRILLTNFAGKSLKINTTMKAEYNRKIFERLNLNGWQKAKQSFETIQIPIVVSNQAKSIRSDLRYEVSSSLNKISNSRQTIKSKQKEQFKVGQSYSYGRDLPESSRKKINQKLDRQLDFLFQNQQSKKLEVLSKNDRGDLVEYDRGGFSPISKKGDIVTYQPQNNFDANVFKSPLQINTPYNKAAQNQRFLQIIMLAALAGFFAALGSNFKHLFK